MVTFFSRKTFSQAGFSLIEMITVIAIFFIVTGIILVNAPQFRDRLSIDLVANEVAINIRTAQVYGSATKTSINGTSYPSFGTHFNVTASPSSFVLYSVDTDSTQSGQNGGFVEEPPTPVEERYVLPNGFVIDRLCSDSLCNNSIPKLDIMYRRPRLDAEFYIGDETSQCSQTDCPQAVIVLKSVKEQKFKKVVVYRNGQISIENFINS